MKTQVFYMGGGNRIKPGKIFIEVNRRHVKLKQIQTLEYPNIKNIEVGYETKEKSLSAGKAVAGGIIFGPLGAIAGAAMGSKSYEGYMRIKYQNGDKEQLITLSSKHAELIANKINSFKELSLNTPNSTQEQRSDESLVRRIAKIYFALYIIPYKYIKRHFSKS